MKTIMIAKNLRELRKARGLTQERLAQVMNVTVGAVSKWESGASVPDLGMILELADFYETSVDVLLGYDWRRGGMGEAVSRIVSLRNERRFDEAALETEKALEKYPNSFDVTFSGAVMYSLMGVERKLQKAYRRAMALFERSLELISQNADDQINEWTIQSHITDLYLCMGQTDKALERMKKHNQAGVNNIAIGLTLASEKAAPDEALRYLTDGLIDSLTSRLRLAQGYAYAYRARGEYGMARDVLAWLCADYRGLIAPGEVSALDRMLAQAEADCAVACWQAADEGGAREHLTCAVASAKRYDQSPSHDFGGIRFQSGGENHFVFDDFGQTALEGVQGLVASCGSGREALCDMLKEIVYG